MYTTKDDLISTCMGYLDRVYKPDSTVYQRVKKSLTKLNNIELDNLATLLTSVIPSKNISSEIKQKSRIKPDPITYDDVSTIKMTTGNETKFLKVIVNGVLEEWVGIGWITLRDAKDEDYFLYPEVK